MKNKEEKKVREIIENLHPSKSLRTDSLRVSVIDDNKQEIWAYGFKNGYRCGVSNKSLDFKKIVEIIEIALEQAKGELILAENSN